MPSDLFIYLRILVLEQHLYDIGSYVPCFYMGEINLFQELKGPIETTTHHSVRRTPDLMFVGKRGSIPSQTRFRNPRIAIVCQRLKGNSL